MNIGVDSTNHTEVRFFTTNDEVTLEYDDTVTLKILSDFPGLGSSLEMFKEYLRESATVNIIDNDRKK